jgi:hypothetical protein
MLLGIFISKREITKCLEHKRVIELSPDDPDGYVSIGLVHMEQPQEAIRFILPPEMDTKMFLR